MVSSVDPGREKTGGLVRGWPPPATVTCVYQAMNMITYSLHTLPLLSTQYSVLTSTNIGDSQSVNNERITPGLSQWGNGKYWQFIPSAVQEKTSRSKSIEFSKSDITPVIVHIQTESFW